MVAQLFRCWIAVTLFAAASLSAMVDPLVANAYRPEERADKAQWCEALYNIVLYVRQRQQLILREAGARINDRMFADMEAIFGDPQHGEKNFRYLIEQAREREIVAFRGKLGAMAIRLQALHSVGCGRTRGGLSEDAETPQPPDRYELAMVRRNLQDLGAYAPSEFKTPVFMCVGDFEMCRTTLNDEFGCGMIFVICVGQQLIPFASK